MATIDDVRLINLPKFLDSRGNLSFAEQGAQIPFEIKRTYWLYDVPGGVGRGGHAEINNDEVVIALSGAFDIVMDDGSKQKTYTLNRSYYGLFIPRGLWREIKDFSTNAVALVFGSIHYDIGDYIRDYDKYREYISSPVLREPDEPVFEKEAQVQITDNHSVFDCTMLELDKHHSDRKGSLTVIENGKTLPFNVKRVYYLYDIPGGESRGSHAHKELSQLIIAASGSFTVTLDDGKCKRSFFLNRPYQGLYVKPGMWRDLVDFSSGAVAMVLASEVYKDEDYIRNYNDFLLYKGIIV